MNVPFHGHVRQYRSIQPEIDANIRLVIESGRPVMGPMLNQFEAEFARYTGISHVVGVNSGTDAIWFALQALGIGLGAEVITQPNTFFAVAEAIWLANAKAVFVDCDPNTKCLDPLRVEAAITHRTKALLPAHMYGHCADMPALRAIADRHNLSIIEDFAHAQGARGDTFRIGELSDIACTSFNICQNLGTFGDGGAAITNNPELDRAIRKLRNHGSEKTSYHSMGANSRLDDLHAGILSAKLHHLDDWNDARRKWAARYSTGLKAARNIITPFEKPGYRHVFHLYVVETRKPVQRELLFKFLLEKGIDVKKHYPIAIFQQDGFPWGKKAKIVRPIKNAERNAATCISLPMFPEITEAEVDFVIAAITEWNNNLPR